MEGKEAEGNEEEGIPPWETPDSLQPPPCLQRAPSLITAGTPHTVSVAGTLAHVCRKPGQWCRLAGKQFTSRWLCSKFSEKKALALRGKGEDEASEKAVSVGIA